MNWIEIDKFLYGLIDAAKDREQIYKDAMKKFSWNRSQAEAAIDPLIKRHGMLYLNNTNTKETVKTPKKRSKPLTKRK